MTPHDGPEHVVRMLRDVEASPYSRSLESVADAVWTMGHSYAPPPKRPRGAHFSSTHTSAHTHSPGPLLASGACCQTPPHRPRPPAPQCPSDGAGAPKVNTSGVCSPRNPERDEEVWGLLMDTRALGAYLRARELCRLAQAARRFGPFSAQVTRLEEWSLLTGLAMARGRLPMLLEINLSFGEALSLTAIRALSAALRFCPQLRVLGLSGVRLGDRGMCALANGLPWCVDIRSLYLSDNGVGNTGALALAQGLRHCERIERLSLAENGFNDRSCRVLSVILARCAALKVLDLSFNRIGPSGVRALAEGLGRCRALRQLDLNGNQLGSHGARALGEALKHCPSLVSLDIGVNRVGAGAAGDLVRALGESSANLRRLGLRCNAVKKAGALAGGLAGLAYLRTLDVSGNGLGEQEVKAVEGGLGGGGGHGRVFLLC